VIVTCPWHRRDAEPLARELGAALLVPPPDPDDPEPLRGTVYRAGERLEIGVEAFAGIEENDLLLWIPRHRSLVAGDTLIDRGAGLIFPRDWAARHGDADAMRTRLLSLLELDIERVLLTHGQVADRGALARALGDHEDPALARP
jgi:glyoxylase-like metal-dependent hydrolase (beta-lactamase superfamily II)